MTTSKLLRRYESRSYSKRSTAPRLIVADIMEILSDWPPWSCYQNAFWEILVCVLLFCHESFAWRSAYISSRSWPMPCASTKPSQGLNSIMTARLAMKELRPGGRSGRSLDHRDHWDPMDVCKWFHMFHMCSRDRNGVKTSSRYERGGRTRLPQPLRRILADSFLAILGCGSVSCVRPDRLLLPPLKPTRPSPLCICGSGMTSSLMKESRPRGWGWRRNFTWVVLVGAPFIRLASKDAGKHLTHTDCWYNINHASSVLLLLEDATTYFWSQTQFIVFWENTATICTATFFCMDEGNNILNLASFHQSMECLVSAMQFRCIQQWQGLGAHQSHLPGKCEKRMVAQYGMKFVHGSLLWRMLFMEASTCNPETSLVSYI